MKFIQIIFLILFIISFQPTNAQYITYETKNNDSYDENLFMNVRLLDIDLGFPVLSFGGGMEMDFFLNNSISIEAGVRFSYYDMKRGLIKGTLDEENTNKLNRFFEMRAGGRFHFSDKMGTKKMKAIVSVNSNGYTTTTNYIPMMVPCRTIFALHYGVQYYTDAVKGKRGPAIPGQLSVGPSVIATDGTEFSEWNSATNINVLLVYGGLSFVKIMKTSMKAGSDVWTFNWFRNSYLDIMFAPYINVQNVTYKNNSYNVQGNGSKGFEKNPFGIRYGISSMSKKKMSYGYEIGWLPGLQNGFFTRASFGFPIQTSTKNKKAH